jgi:hypothetical protein
MKVSRPLGNLQAPNGSWDMRCLPLKSIHVLVKEAPPRAGRIDVGLHHELAIGCGR